MGQSFVNNYYHKNWHCLTYLTTCHRGGISFIAWHILWLVTGEVSHSHLHSQERAKQCWPSLAAAWRMSPAAATQSTWSLLQRHLPPAPSDDSVYLGLVSVCMHSVTIHIDCKEPDHRVYNRWVSATETHPSFTIPEDTMWLPIC